LGDALKGGICVIKRGQVCRTQRIGVKSADHPVPSRRSWEAGLAVLDYAARQVHPGDVVVAGITGGSSALIAVPPTDVPWEAKVELHRLLLASGLPIDEVNTVRKHVSRIKGGRLARIMPEANIINLTVSDVAGDALDLITDPTVLDSSSYGDAIRILQTAGLWEEVHPAVRQHLLSKPAPVNALSQVRESVLLINGAWVADQLYRYAASRNLHPFVFATTLTGEARDAGRVLAAYARERAIRREPIFAICAGGETTATVPRDALGAGGPNLELTLSFAMEVRGYDRVALVSVDSDGQDGSTELAGGMADAATVKEVNRAREALVRHRVLALARENFGVETGQTGTNINDISLLLVE
jgi:glycerate-2-kinase